MDYAKPLLRHDAEGLCVLTLNRPDQLNALNTAIFRELEAHTADLETKRDSIGCVILRANGRSFCAGADLKDAPAQGAVDPYYKAKVLERFEALPQPLVAAVHGHCLTGGLELALACDFIFAAESARFADTHGKWGMVAGWGLATRLPRRVGVTKAKEMGMTATQYPAHQATAMGLVNFCVPDDKFEAELDALARRILANSWFTNRAVKKMMSDLDGLTLKQSLALERYSNPGRAPDYAQRVAGFAKKG
jgi:enoyl-CoA hydratase/carnithine racemase